MTHDQWTDSPNGSGSPEEGSFTISQTGNSFTLSENARTYRGKIDGTMYTYSMSYLKEGSTVTMTTQFTLHSSTSGTGSTATTWTDGEFSYMEKHSLSIGKELPPNTLSIQLLLLGGE